MSDEFDIEDRDRRLFRSALAGVRRLESDRALHRPTPPRAEPVQTRRDEAEVLAGLRDGPLQAEEHLTGEELYYRRAGVRLQTMRRLRRGAISVEGHLDLHGHSAAEARVALDRYLRDSLARGRRCVRVVHGKGKGSRDRRPVLRRMVEGALRRNGDVLAFCSAPGTDGGTGAAYVLLRKARSR